MEMLLGDRARCSLRSLRRPGNGFRFVRQVTRGKHERKNNPDIRSRAPARLLASRLRLPCIFPFGRNFRSRFLRLSRQNYTRVKPSFSPRRKGSAARVAALKSIPADLTYAGGCFTRWRTRWDFSFSRSGERRDFRHLHRRKKTRNRQIELPILRIATPLLFIPPHPSPVQFLSQSALRGTTA